MKKIKVLMVSVLSLSLFLPFQSASAATTGTTGVNIGVSSAGALSLTVPAKVDFPELTYADGEINGYTDFDTSANTLTVLDERGTGEGWVLSVQSSAITEVGGLGLSFENDSLMMYAPYSVYGGTAASGDPTVTTTPYARIQSAPFTLVTSSAGQGLGEWKVVLGGLSVSSTSANQLVDKVNYPTQPTPYEATLTFSLVTGP